jgi:hypothetical protein
VPARGDFVLDRMPVVDVREEPSQLA